MPANSSDILKQMSGTELLKLFPKYYSKLDEYVRSAKTMDEQVFRINFENDKGTLPLCFIQLTGIPINLYRSRLKRKVGEKEDLTSPQTFSYVPLTSANEHFPNLQRANFSGQSVFYGSLSPTTNFREISEDVTAGEEVYMAKWNFSPNANLMLYKVFPPKETFLNDKLKKIFELKKEESEVFGEFFQKLGDIMMSNDEGNAKYLVSALVANFVYSFPPMTLPNGSKLERFDGILYPSAKIDGGSELNLAIKPECIDKFATLQYVVRGTVAEDLRSINYSDIGFCKDGKIQWYSPWIDHNDIIPTKLFVWATNNRLIDIEDGILYDKVHKEVPNPWAVFEYRKDLWADEYIRKYHSSLRGNYNLEDLEEECLPSATFSGHAILLEVDGWKLIRDGNEFEIDRIGFEFQIKSTFKRTQEPHGVKWI